MQRHKAIIAASVVSATLLVGAAGISLNNALAGSDEGPGRLNPVSVQSGQEQVATPSSAFSSSQNSDDNEFDSDEFDDEFDSDESDDDREEDHDEEDEYEGGEDDD